MSRPSNTMLPALGCNSPEIALSVVVLPAPFAPMSAKDVGIFLDHGGGTFGDDAAVVEDDDPIRHPHDHRHVVLDQEDGDARGTNALHQFHDSGALARIHAG